MSDSAAGAALGGALTGEGAAPPAPGHRLGWRTVLSGDKGRAAPGLLNAAPAEARRTEPFTYRVAERVKRRRTHAEGRVHVYGANDENAMVTAAVSHHPLGYPGGGHGPNAAEQLPSD